MIREIDQCTEYPSDKNTIKISLKLGLQTFKSVSFFTLLSLFLLLLFQFLFLYTPCPLYPCLISDCVHFSEMAISKQGKFIFGLKLFFFPCLKGQLQGHTIIFKGLKMTFRTKILKNKLYHINQHQKYYKLCFDNFSLRRLFFDRALDRGQVEF